MGVTFLLVAGGWIAIGLALGLVMGRRGYGSWPWFVAGAVLGPLAIVLAVDARVHRAHEDRVVAAGESWGGPVDVLIGVDGSPEAAAASSGVIALFGPRLGRITLASVAPFSATDQHERAALDVLERAAGHFATGTVETEMLSGRPDEALARFAAEGSYDVVAVGTRGKGGTKALLGSVATRLARGSKVPVLMFGAGGAGSTTEEQRP